MKNKTIKNADRLARRTPKEIARHVAKVASLLRRRANGLRSEDIRVALGYEPRELPRILAMGIKTRAFRVLGGNTRARVYGIKGKKR